MKALLIWILSFIPKNQRMVTRHKDPLLSIIVGIVIGSILCLFIIFLLHILNIL